jgi:xanthine dehydrogenase accessory factor
MIAQQYAANDIALYGEIIRLIQLGSASALATVIESAGSSPRKTGAKMLVRGDGSIMGSVGGGKVEQEVIAAALIAIREGKPRIESFELTKQYGHVCGGALRVYLEPNNIDPRLVVIGAGHIGAALTALARFVGFHVTVIDEREEYACPERLPEENEIVAEPVAKAMEGLDVEIATAIVIATTGFEQDLTAVQAALQTTAGYIGVVGSTRKKCLLEETLRHEGYGTDKIARVIIPAGLAIRSETPQEVAVSIIAQLIEFRRGNGA